MFLLSRANTLIFPQRFASCHFPTSSLKSPLESNLVRMLTNQIKTESEYLSPHQAEEKLNAFRVEDRAGEQFATLKGRSAIDENIKIEATMFDGISPNTDELHISLLVDIIKGERVDMLEFVCSAWPQRLEVQKFSVIEPATTLSQPYTGPDFKGLDKKFQSAMYEFLNARGVNDNLCLFLHRYVWNKDKVERIQHLKLVKSYVERCVCLLPLIMCWNPYRFGDEVFLTILTRMVIYGMNNGYD
ncbi:uncharacterized protein At2g39795, mitochondrial-like [Bidens hawaiensis]|uniref:uncharacterized protein At2g39795, mitochondrial-like n=1 Tax=Bidens hawaiensis TaxID=980011 RepID=UPI00404AE52A